jgi:hypothetical protein
VQRQCRFGSQAAIVCQILEPRLARGNDGHFGHGEDAIDQDEYDEKKYIHVETALAQSPCVRFRY